MAVINYEAVWRDYILPELFDWAPDMVIADESQRIKSHDAAQSIAMHRLGDRAAYKMILSGTPIQNSAIDLYSQFRFLDPTVFGSNFYAFRNRYARMGGFGASRSSATIAMSTRQAIMPCAESLQIIARANLDVRLI